MRIPLKGLIGNIYAGVIQGLGFRASQKIGGGGVLLWVPIMRLIVFCGLYWGCRYFLATTM